ncbi:MAG: Hsp33 family molecular chaperone HslO [Gammaproteobacteria bacterium]|nr:MAG: Hsp33 family molecular chaperone HslO [Gammaproteobacteria bacterium]
MLTLEKDFIQRFLFEGLSIRAVLVQLDASFQAVTERRVYPDDIRDLIGQSMAATALLASTIKFKGNLILQMQGEGDITYLVAQCTHNRQLRAMARWSNEPETGLSLDVLFPEGRIVITIESEEWREPYQGMVAIEDSHLESALARYFSLSEQLETRLWLAADPLRAAGLLIQRLPGESDQEDWRRVELLAATLTRDELLELPATTLMRRLFHEEDLRVFEPDVMSFRCTCSQERITETLRMLGEQEVSSILSEEGRVEVRCEFCNQPYMFDAVDVSGVFAVINLPTVTKKLQ